MKNVRRSEEHEIVRWLEEGEVCRVGPYVCTPPNWNRGNYEITSAWFSDRKFRTSSATVAADMLLHSRWKEPGPTAV